jgi:peptide/nickel transport system permease protein
LQGAWWWFVAPGACVALLGAGLALINFGIDEVANPRLRAEKKLSKREVRVAAEAGPKGAAG